MEAVNNRAAKILDKISELSELSERLSMTIPFPCFQYRCQYEIVVSQDRDSYK